MFTHTKTSCPVSLSHSFALLVHLKWVTVIILSVCVSICYQNHWKRKTVGTLLADLQQFFLLFWDLSFHYQCEINCSQRFANMTSCMPDTTFGDNVEQFTVNVWPCSEKKITCWFDIVIVSLPICLLLVCLCTSLFSALLINEDCIHLNCCISTTNPHCTSWSMSLNVNLM